MLDTPPNDKNADVTSPTKTTRPSATVKNQAKTGFPFFSKDRRPKIWLASLVIFPLVAAGVIMASIEPQFTGTVTYAIKHPATETGRQTVILGNYRKELVETAWRSCNAKAIVSSDRPGISARDWSVKENPETSSIILSAATNRVENTSQVLDEITRSFLDRLALVAQEHATKSSLGETLILERISNLKAKREKLRDELQKSLESQPDRQPVEYALKACDEMSSHRASLQQIRENISNFSLEREKLQASPEPNIVEIEPAVRQNAYNKNVVLSEDLRLLEVRMQQLRSTMLQVLEKANEQLDNLLAEANLLCQLPDAPEVASIPSDLRVLFDRLVENAQDYRLRAISFAQDWTRCFIELQNMKIDPSDPTILVTYDRITKQIADYMFENTGSLTALNLRVRLIKERAANNAKTFAFTDLLNRRYQNLRDAHQVFETAGSQLNSQKNYVLSAALESVQGLVYRSRNVRQELDQALEIKAREHIILQRQKRLAELATEISKQREYASEKTDLILETQRRIHQSLVTVPDFVKTVARTAAAEEKLSLIETQLAELETQRESFMSSIRLTSPVLPDAVQASQPIIDSRPDNLSRMVCYSMFAWCVTLLTFLGTAKIITVARKHSNR